MAEIMCDSSPIRETHGNVQQEHFNTITGSSWKGENRSFLSNGGSTEGQTVLARDESRIAQASENEGFPFHAKVGITGEDPTNEMLQNQETVTGSKKLQHEQERIEQYGPGEDSAATEPGSRLGAVNRPVVQFAETTDDTNSATPSQLRNLAPTTSERPSHFRSSSLINKILALSPSSHSRNQTSFLNGDATINEHATTPGQTPHLADLIDEHGRPRNDVGEGEADADAEDSAVEDRMSPLQGQSMNKRRRMPPAGSGGPGETPTRNRALFPIRRAATESAAAVENHRLGVSEDEGRERIARNTGWRRRSSAWLHGGQPQSSPALPRQSARDSSETGRPTNRRFFSTLAGGSAAADGTQSPRRPRGENRAQDAWNKLRNSMKLIVQKNNKEIIDHAKSAELMAELLAGSPAALILASHFQRDEREKKRIPVLLEQIKISIPSSSPIKEDSATDRHAQFHIELEYGSGLMRMKWTIDRTLRDFINLHLKYKLQGGTQKYIQRRAPEDSPRNKLPRFPRSAFPILRGVRGLQDDDDDEED